MGQEFPLISIIVPVYNIEDYVEKCLVSVAKQTYQNLEILIVDDGSTDSSGDICDRVAASDNRIKVYHTQNKGLVAARKFGLKNSTGKFIGFVDGDDYIDEQMYEQLLKKLLEDDADYIHSMYIEERGELSSKKGRISIQNISFCNEKEKAKFLEQYVLNDMNREYITPSIWSKLFKAEFIKRCYEAVPDEQQYGEDWICLVRSIMEADKISFLNEVYYHYIVRNGSLSHESGSKYLFDEMHLLHYLLKCTLDYKDTESLQMIMYEFVQHSLINLIEETTSEKFYIPRFYWGDIALLEGKKIILYGAGRVGVDYYAQICKYRKCEIILWVDSNAQNIEFEYCKVHDVKEIKDYVFDYVLIAVNDEKTAEMMRNQLKEMGIATDKVVWNAPLRF